MEVLHVETEASGSRVEIRSRNRVYMACVKPNGEIIAVDVERPERLLDNADGRYFEVNRIKRKRIPQRIAEAVHNALQSKH